MSTLASLASRVSQRCLGRPLIVGGTIQWERFSFRFHASPPLLERAKRRGIESTICRLLLSHLTPGAVGIDVGMNYGFVTTLMSLAVGPTGRVYSFEPVPYYHDAVSRTLRDNQMSNVTLHASWVGSGGNEPSSAGASQVALDDVLAGVPRVDVIKIDVDGGDYEVLQGARRLLAKFHPVVVVEMHRNQEEIYRFLESLGYRWLVGMRGEPVAPGEWPPNLIAAIDPLRFPEKGALSSPVQ